MLRRRFVWGKVGGGSINSRVGTYTVLILSACGSSCHVGRGWGSKREDRR